MLQRGGGVIVLGGTIEVQLEVFGGFLLSLSLYTLSAR